MPQQFYQTPTLYIAYVLIMPQQFYQPPTLYIANHLTVSLTL